MKKMLIDTKVGKMFGIKDRKDFEKKLVDWGVFYWSYGRIYPKIEFAELKEIQFEYRSHRRVIWFSAFSVQYIGHCKNLSEYQILTK